ncbi:MAG: YaiO family outer membrane beta-barrel protein [Geminicoccaceae bacterium]|nr:YaiO family outer membrane beta-barrel protein [Geminicoccaceae bacterium]
MGSYRHVRLALLGACLGVPAIAVAGVQIKGDPVDEGVIGEVGPQDLALDVREEVRILRDVGDFDAASVRLDEALAATPDDVDLLLLRGQILVFQNRPAEAEAVLASAVARAPDYLDLHLTLARARAEQGEIATARQSLDPLAEAHGDHVPLRMLQARLALADGDPRAARDYFERVLAVEPANGQALLGSGDASLEDGRVADARNYYERALEVPGVASLAARRLVVLGQRAAPFELIVDASYSALDGGRSDWREARATLAWAIDERYRAYLGSTLAERFDETDTMFSGTLVRRLDDRKSVNFGVDVTPGADFLPEWRVRVGADAALSIIREELEKTVAFGELAIGEYPDGLVKSLTLGLTQYLGDGSSWLTLRTVHTLDADGNYDLGLSGRIDWGLSDRTRLFAGLGQEMDRSDRGADTLRSVFAGAEYDLSDRYGVFGSITYEDRDRGVERWQAGMGLKVRFGEE